MRFKSFRKVCQAIVLLIDASIELAEEVDESGDLDALFEIKEVTRDLKDGLERLAKFDIRVAERKLNGEKRVDKPITVN